MLLHYEAVIPLSVDFITLPCDYYIIGCNSSAHKASVHAAQASKIQPESRVPQGYRDVYG